MPFACCRRIERSPVPWCLAVEATFSEDDIPADIKEHMQSDEESGNKHMMMDDQGGAMARRIVGGQSSGQ